MSVVSSAMPESLREHYRRLGATLHHAQTESGLKTLMITSAVPDVTLVSASAGEVVLDLSGVRTRFTVTAYGRRLEVESALGTVALTEVPRFADPAERVVEGATVAPMPGTVARLTVTEGALVAAGEELLVLEAMKMQHRVVAATGGVVTELRVAVGQQVAAGAVLAVIEEET